MLSRISSEPLFDLFSYGRRGSTRRDCLSPADIRQIARTVGRSPEVIVKVLPRGANDLTAVRKHLDYIGRKGELELETDSGDNLRGGEGPLEDWDLELDDYRSRSDLLATRGRQPARLVHKLIFSMPAGTRPDKVLAAVRNFCREEFALKHRYALALHTDEPHPHVHVVIKAVSEQGQRLHIRKATLREWRAGFARHLLALGVVANATPRYVRGETRPRKSDGIYRASLRGESTHMRERVDTVARELAKRDLQIEPGKVKLVETRNKIQHAWAAVGDILNRDRHPELAAHSRQFADEMPPALTEKEYFAAKLLERVREPRAREGPASR